MMTDNARLLAYQQELIHKLSWSRSFGCYNRTGFEEMKWPEIAASARWIIFFDVDGVHALNEQSGTYEVFDEKMRTVLQALRSTDVVAAQWRSGDEFLVCVRETPERPTQNPDGLIKRLMEELAKQGLTATFAKEQVKSMFLKENVEPASDRVLEIKKARGTPR
jgi:GGDEF domain-containing protein